MTHQFIPLWNELDNCVKKLGHLFIFLGPCLEEAIIIMSHVDEDDMLRIDQSQSSAETGDVVRTPDG